jgi:hypothetical protein
MTTVPDADDVEAKLRERVAERISLARGLAEARRTLLADRATFDEDARARKAEFDKTDKANRQRVADATAAAKRAGLSEDELTQLGLTDKKPRRVRNKPSANTPRAQRRAADGRGAGAPRIADETATTPNTTATAQESQ